MLPRTAWPSGLWSFHEGVLCCRREKPLNHAPSIHAGDRQAVRMATKRSHKMCRDMPHYMRKRSLVRSVRSCRGKENRHTNNGIRVLSPCPTSNVRTTLSRVWGCPRCFVCPSMNFTPTKLKSGFFKLRCIIFRSLQRKQKHIRLQMTGGDPPVFVAHWR